MKKLRRALPRLWTILYAAARRVEIGKGTTIALSASVKRVSGGSISLGKGCRVLHGALIWTHGGRIEIGNRTTINPYAIVYGHGGLRIGNGVRIAAHAVIIPGNHRFEPDTFIHKQGLQKKGITIEDDVWIGTGARILDGVTLAHGCIIGAGAVVTRSTAPYGIYGGVPARQIGDRREQREGERDRP